MASNLKVNLALQMSHLQRFSLFEVSWRVCFCFGLYLLDLKCGLVFRHEKVGNSMHIRLQKATSYSHSCSRQPICAFAATFFFIGFVQEKNVDFLPIIERFNIY